MWRTTAMRPALVVGLMVLLGVPAVGCSAATPPALAAQRPENPSWVVEGYGENGTDAEQDALKKAHFEVVRYLQQQEPAFEWLPGVDYVRRLVQVVEPEKTADFGHPVG